MKNIILTWIILLSITASIYAQTEKTLIKTLSEQDAYEHVVFNLPGHVNVIEWENKTIRIITNITTQKTDDQIIKSLIVAGRYNLNVVKNETENNLVIDMPKQDKVIIINGVELDDVVDFEIYVPKGMVYQLEKHIAAKNAMTL